MRTDILRKLIILCCVLLVTACQNNDDVTGTEGPASLTLTVRSRENSTLTRGVEDLDDNGTVTDEELFVDGRKMYRLAVFLFDGTKAVSSTVLEADDPRFTNGNTEATVSFTFLDYSKTYKLYAVANYGNHEGITGNLTSITESNVTTALTVTASGDNLCNHNTAYPLVLKQDINLTPGANTVSGELSRTYARVRINVRNQSTLNNLYITKLNFASKFTRKKADLFTEGGAAEVSPVTTSADAITPFVQDLMIPMMGGNGNVSEATVFDSYMLESTGGSYNYTLGLKYMGDTEEVYTVSSSATNNHNNIEDGAMYVIYSTNAKKYLYANGSSVGAGNSYLTNGELNHNYVWKFKRNSSNTNRYTIESMGATGYFMQSSQVSTSKVPLTVSPGNSDYFTASTSSSNIRLQSTKSNYYLSVNSSTVAGHSSSSNQNRRNLYLYKVEKTQTATTISHEENIPIRIVDKNSGEATALTEIRRNDFIDILVSVTYNEKTGNVEFQVADWEQVNGEVTFD